jgi:CheY-like chemotaxis protein
LAAATRERFRIVLADDHPSTREHLRRLLDAEPDLEVIGVARNGAEALRLILELRPDVAVLDREMPRLDGLEVAARLQRKQVPVRVVLFTLDVDALGEFRNGVLVAKDAPLAVLLAAVRGPRQQEAVVHAARPLRVLVVEDDENTRQALVDFLTDEGFVVESAVDGQEAVGVAASGAIDVIVLGLWMPVLDGAALAEIWRRHPGSRRVPIVAMSGPPQGDAISVDVGASGFRVNPVDLPALAALLHTTVDRPPGTDRRT